MKITFELSNDDIVHFNKYVITRSSNFFRRSFPYWIFGLFLIYIIYKSWNDFHYSSLILVLITAFLFYLIIWGSSKLMDYNIRKLVKRNPRLTGYRELELKEGQLVYRFDNNEKTYQKEDFQRIEESNDYIYLFNQRTSAIIIPRRSFDSEQQKEKFKALLQK